MTALARAADAAQNLLRTALLGKLAVDLEDPALARRAAREALASARLLCGLDFPDGRGWVGDEDGPLPAVAELLELVHPSAGPDDLGDLDDDEPDGGARPGGEAA